MSLKPHFIQSVLEETAQVARAAAGLELPYDTDARYRHRDQCGPARGLARRAPASQNPDLPLRCPGAHTTHSPTVSVGF